MSLSRENPLEGKEVTPEQRELILYLLESVYEDAKESSREVDDPRGGRRNVVSLDSLRRALYSTGAAMTQYYPNLY